jgi:hypothetical protein
MILDIKSIRVYIISPCEGKYKERSAEVLKRVQALGFKNAEIFKSIPDENNTNSLTKTVIQIFNNEMNESEPFIILEDDCAVFYDKNAIEIYEKTDIVYLGVASWIYPHDYSTLGKGFHIRPNQPSDIIDYSECLTKINGMTGGHAIMFINRQFMRDFIVKMEPLLNVNMAHDLVFATMHKYYNVFALKEPMFYQDSTLGGQEGVTKLIYRDGRYC